MIGNSFKNWKVFHWNRQGTVRLIRVQINEVYGKFMHKQMFVAIGPMADPLSSITYSSVVFRDSIRIGFVLAPLNNLNICTMDIGNTYLNY